MFQSSFIRTLITLLARKQGIIISLVALGWIFVTPGHAEIEPDSIVGLWLLDEGKGKSAKDSSGNELHGMFTGTPKWREGVFGQCLELGGNGGTVEISGFAQDFPAEEVTITSWVKVAGSKNQDLFSLEPCRTPLSVANSCR